MHVCGQYISGPILFTIVDVCTLKVLCYFHFTGTLWSGLVKGGVANICQRGEGTSREPSERSRLVFFTPLLSTSRKGKRK